MASSTPTVPIPVGAAIAAPPRSLPWAEPAADRLLKALAWMLLAYVWRIQDVFPILAKIQLPLLVGGLSLAFFVASRDPARRLQYLRAPLVWLVVGLLGIMLAGVPTSLWPRHSLTFALKDEMTNLVFMGLVALSVRSMRDLEWYAKINLYGALFYAMIVNVFFHVGNDGRLGNLVYYDANDFALIMVSTIPFAVYFLRPESPAKQRLLGLLALGLFLLGVVKSGSRGGFIGLVAVLVYVLLRYRAVPSRLRLLAAVTGVGLIAVLGSDKYWTQISTILNPTSDYNWTDPQGRRQVWERGLGYVEHHPVFGVGVGSYPIAEGTLSDIAHDRAARGQGFKWSVAHNSFLETAAELGVPGLAVFLAMFVVALRLLARVGPGRRYGPWITRRETALAQMLLGALFGFAVAGFFVSAEYFSYLYFLFGLSLGLDKVLRLRRDGMMAALARYVPPVRLSSAPILQPELAGGAQP